MKYLVYLIILFSGSVYCQNDRAFRRDYNYVSFYENDKWSNTKEAKVSVIFNINENSDIKIVFYGGKEALYRKISKIEEGEVDGKEYQIVTTLDDKGNKIFFQLFNTFLKIFDTHMIIQLDE